MEKKVTVFVDQEWVLYMLENLFSKEEFDPKGFLPKHARWEQMITSLSSLLGGTGAASIFWYTINSMDYFPQGDWKSMPFEEAESILRKIKPVEKKFKKLRTEKQRQALVNEYRYRILKNQKKQNAYFDRKQDILDSMEESNSGLLVRKTGWQASSLIDNAVSPQKAVNSGMIADMFTESSNYDLALLLTGNGEFVPAVAALSETGKEFACLNFPVSPPRKPARISRKLADTMDYIIDVPLEDLASFMGIDIVG